MSIDIIIIDDDPASVLLHKMLVQKIEISKDPQCFSSGRDALHSLDRRASDEPRLLLLDINMPMMSGWELLEQVSLRPYVESVFAIIISSSDDPLDHKKAKTFKRVIDYLEKPIDGKELQNKVKSFIFTLPCKGIK